MIDKKFSRQLDTLLPVPGKNIEMVTFHDETQETGYLIRQYQDGDKTAYQVSLQKNLQETKLSTPSTVPLELLKRLFPNYPLVILADCLSDVKITEGSHTLVQEAEHPVGYALQYQDLTVLNIDHHADTEIMRKAISSGNLATNYIQGVRELPPHTPILVTHTDADSVLTTMILLKLVPLSAMSECNEAVIAADHTGEETDLGDLLQVTEVLQDLAFSIQLVKNYFAAKNQAGTGRFELLSFLKKAYPASRVKVEFQGRAQSLAEAVMLYRQQHDEVSQLFSQAEKISPDYDRRVIRLSNGYELWHMGQGVYSIVDRVVPEPGQPLRPLLPTEYLSLAIPVDLISKAKVVIFSRPKPLLDSRGKVAGAKTNSDGQLLFDIKVALMPSQYSRINLKKFGLEKLGWGGRHNMGSNSRLENDQQAIYDALYFGQTIANQLALP